MSCFIVSDQHLDALLQFCSAHAGSRSDQFPDSLRKAPALTEMGRTLRAANVAAFRCRYEDRHAEDLPTEAYTYHAPAVVVSPVAFIKLLECLDYQCSDLTEWETTSEAATLRNWTALALHRLPGFSAAYDTAPWSI